MKTIIVLKNNGGRLANQLWNYACIYAFCLEKGYACSNPSFFLYENYFDFKKSGFFWFLFKKFAQKFRKISLLAYKIFSNIVAILKSGRTINSIDEFLLPPSENKNTNQKYLLDNLMADKENYYFCGWLFRNPQGLVKHRGRILELFTPKEELYNRAMATVNELREEYEIIIGVHIRHGDYLKWESGKYYFTFEEVAKILIEILPKYPPNSVAFVICSDDKIDENFFAGLNYKLGPGDEVGDLYALASCDMVIGPNSTYGAWAAFYGDIPFIQMSKQPIDLKSLPNI